MRRDQAIGAVLLLGSLAFIAMYGYLLFFAGREISLLLLKITAFAAIAVIGGILAWIGYTLATTPPPKPIEEIEKEIEEELKKLEQELKQQEAAKEQQSGGQQESGSTGKGS
ncbi:hypothetical protein Pyrfu_1120 [Pyrolobus fumarii 1A]|uniref:Transcriptional regulator n=1 Tax=Pyrolobus fumarii (strain DSM 11204 / 1A) TaxID=694429 RepID=G0EFG2_PYRF1|nr:transcriptional regulator [Pyrolobus fumarii]AEM38986.1 hypothetical protein Pyrfu_1120 [Pyrolobus fumarii 1A]